MNLLIPGIFLVVGLILLVIDLILIERKSVGQMLITMQFGVPKNLVGIVANFIVIISGIVLVLVYLGIV